MRELTTVTFVSVESTFFNNAHMAFLPPNMTYLDIDSVNVTDQGIAELHTRPLRSVDNPFAKRTDCQQTLESLEINNATISHPTTWFELAKMSSLTHLHSGIADSAVTITEVAQHSTNLLSLSLGRSSSYRAVDASEAIFEKICKLTSVTLLRLRTESFRMPFSVLHMPYLIGLTIDGTVAD